MAICIAYLGVGAVAIPTGIISAGFVEQYQRKSSISDIKNADIKEIAEIKIDKTQAGKTVEEIEETDFVSIYLIFRDDLSILPQKDTMLKLNDIIIIRDGNQEYFLNILLCVPIYKIWISGKEDKVNISTQSTTLLDMLNSSSSTGKSKSAADSYIDVLIQNNNLRYQQKMKEVLGYDTSSSSKDAQYEKVASSASNLNSVISSLSNESLWNEDSSDYSKDKVYDTVNNFVSAYNTLITNINTVGSTIENTYKTKLDKLVTDNKEALAAVGITVDDNGKLSVDTDKLKSADMSELKKMLGSESELMKGIKEQSGSVNNIVSEALSIQKSLSGLYNSSSSSVDVSDLLYGTSYDSKG